jgi:hypothetical protein
VRSTPAPRLRRVEYRGGSDRSLRQCCDQARAFQLLGVPFTPAPFPSNQNPIRFFDYYSWRIFLSMVLLAAEGQCRTLESRSGSGSRGVEAN